MIDHTDGKLQEVLSLIKSANSVQSSKHAAPSKNVNTSNQYKGKFFRKITAAALQVLLDSWKLCTLEPSATAKLTTTIMILSATCLVALLQDAIG